MQPLTALHVRHALVRALRGRTARVVLFRGHVWMNFASQNAASGAGALIDASRYVSYL